MHMQALAMVAGGSVTVLSHPSLQGIASGTGISGSTAWHGAFRFRQYLKGTKPEAGEQPDGDVREVQFKKNQYGPTGDPVIVRYQHGLFLPERGLSSLEQAGRDATVEETFILIGKKLIERGQELSPAQTSHSYAPTVIGKQPEAKGLKKAELVAALGRLLDQRRLGIDTLRPGSTKEKRVIRF
jgi:RecA-family ATPase